MSFLAPIWLLAGAAAAAGVVALHFFSRRRPRSALLPTARFVPDVPARATSSGRRPADAPLLALRVAALLAIGAALAGPVATPPRRPVARVVLADVSRAVRSLAEVRDGATRFLEAGGALVVFDSTARVVRGDTSAARGAIAARGPGRRPPGSLSAALALAVRAAGELRARADSLELVVVSPLVREEWDRATADIRRLWPGRARLVRVSAAEPAPAPRIAFKGPADDPLRAALALPGARPRSAGVTRLVRRAPSGSDSAWARATGGALVVWPVEPASLWPRRSRPDTVGAVVLPGLGAADALVVVAAFARAAAAPAGAPLARWVDGEPAAVERPLGAGCERDVAVPVTSAGDLVLRRSMRLLVAALAEACGGPTDLAPLGDPQVAVLRGAGALLATDRLAGDGDPGRSPAAAWLLGVAAALLLVEMAVRSRAERRAAEDA